MDLLSLWKDGNGTLKFTNTLEMLFSIAFFVYFTNSLFILVKQNAWIPTEKPLESHLTIVFNAEKRTPKGQIAKHPQEKPAVNRIIDRF